MILIMIIISFLSILFLIQGSLEELFIRVETAKKTDFDDIVDWLSDSGKRNKGSYKNVATILQEPFSLQQQAEKLDQTDWTTADELRDLKSDADNLDIELGMGRVDTINEIQTKLNVVENLETKQIDLREQLIAEREVLKQDLAEATTPEEVKIASRELKELSPQSLGGIRSGQTRRTPKAFATLFE